MNEYVMKLKYTIKIKVKMKDLSRLIFFFLSLSFTLPHPSLSFSFVSISFFLTCLQGQNLELQRQQSTAQEPRCKPVKMRPNRYYAGSQGHRLVLCSHWNLKESEISTFIFPITLFSAFRFLSRFRKLSVSYFTCSFDFCTISCQYKYSEFDPLLAWIHCLFLRN